MKKPSQRMAAIVHFEGHNIHPSIAKDRMVNAVRAAADFVAKLPRETCSPETTREREGIHPSVHNRGWCWGSATVELILRSFETEDLKTYAEQLQATADAVVQAMPGLKAQCGNRAAVSKSARRARSSARSCDTRKTGF